MNHNYTKADLIDAIVQARTSYLPWAHILSMEIDRLTVELVCSTKAEEKIFPKEYPPFILTELSENKENE